ncbi:helix-turn-helix domain-containing protein [Dechloromonas sp. A34]|uniref:helix-turn-helix domain-containing protein n=1 Tax=Dechloromonas sp. A34 TaxID=447588 RepID=UPI00224988B3|nr:helix-turn-helix domain-containing protein [Dechloromonas sp. A34]
MHQLQAPSPYSYQRRKTSDSDEHAAALGKWDQIYDQLSPGSFEGKVVDIWFEGLQIFRETTNRSVSQAGTTWKGSYVVGIPVHMKGTGLFAKQVLTRDSILTFHSDKDFTLTTPENFDVVALAIPQNMLIEALQPRSNDELGKLFPSSPSVLVTPPGQLDELRNCLLSIFDPSNFEPGLLAYPQVQKAMSSAIIGHLAEVLGSASAAPMPSRSFKGRCQVVREATDYALARTTEPITVGDLCAKLNISRRMLNYCFLEVLNTNPVQYLRTLRLNGVRRELREAAGSAQAIRDVACKWGFWHLSRFAAEYRALFGELPSDTQRGQRA